MFKKLSCMLALVLTACMICSSAMACTAIYVGAALTDDGTAIFARSEDLSNSRNKVMYVSPAGNHKAGDAYQGCFGFTYTFEKDSYSYTAFRDDNLEGVEYVCPNCGGTHAHTPYEAGGTNEMGVSVSATETLYGSDLLQAIDPYEDTGIEEAEITTVILSQAATAREGVEMILAIYDEAGCNTGAGIFVADDKEIWYIENTTGHQYVALKLPDTLVFAEPNISIIGLIDLDDTENVIASPNLIAVAQQAGTFVGDADANVIDYRASYVPEQTAVSRLVNALAYFNAAYDYSETEPDYSLYTISNVDAEGNIVTLNNGIELDRAFSVDEVVGYYHIPGIGSSRNLETHIFQIGGEDCKIDTVEWVAVDDASCNVFVPYYPMLTTDVEASLKVSTAKAAFVEEQPTEGIWYATTTTKRVDGERVQVEGFRVLPENWADSYYWSLDAITNLVAYGNLTDEQVASVKDAMAAKQASIYEAFAQVKADVAAAASDEAAAEIATAASMDMAQQVHALAVSLVETVTSAE